MRLSRLVMMAALLATWHQRLEPTRRQLPSDRLESFVEAIVVTLDRAAFLAAAMSFSAVSATAEPVEAQAELIQGSNPQDGSPRAGVVVGSVAGNPVSLAEFIDFIERTRGPGYRPATLGEAERLLRLMLRERVAPAHNDPSAKPEPTGSGRLMAMQRAEILDRRLQELGVEIDSERLSEIVVPVRAGAPPLPPDFELEGDEHE